MCTLSIVPLEERVLRLVFSRDEQVSRPEALPPRVASFEGRQALLPIDPVGGGTWIAVNDAGLAFALLNLYEGNAGDTEGDPQVSRGLIIPVLLGSSSIEEALVRARGIRDRGLRPYRLVMTDRRQIAVVTSRGGPRVEERHDATAPRLFTSSGLGDRLVEKPRRDLFERLVATSYDPVVAQDRFHRHRWPSMPHLSVRMNRGSARTVSLTVLRMEPGRSRMTYRTIGRAATTSPRVSLAAMAVA